MMSSKIGRENVSELYRNSRGAVYQNDHRHTLILEFNGKNLEFNVQGFLQLKKTVDHINLEDLFLSSEHGCDLQIIHHQTSGHLFVLTLCELVAIQDLLHGAKAMMELNSIICARLQPCEL